MPVLFCSKIKKTLWSTVYFFISGMKIQKYSYGIFLDRFIDIFYQQRLRLYQSDAGVDGLLRNLPFAIHRCLDSSDLSQPQKLRLRRMNRHFSSLVLCAESEL